MAPARACLPCPGHHPADPLRSAKRSSGVRAGRSSHPYGVWWVQQAHPLTPLCGTSSFVIMVASSNREVHDTAAPPALRRDSPPIFPVVGRQTPCVSLSVSTRHEHLRPASLRRTLRTRPMRWLIALTSVLKSRRRSSELRETMSAMRSSCGYVTRSSAASSPFSDLAGVRVSVARQRLLHSVLSVAFAPPVDEPCCDKHSESGLEDIFMDG